MNCFYCNIPPQGIHKYKTTLKRLMNILTMEETVMIRKKDILKKIACLVAQFVIMVKKIC